MMGCNRAFVLAMGALALALAVPADAQENLDSGKSGAQLFAANCAVCHKSPQTLSKSGGMFGLSTFLREHYTSSRETAGAVATYLESLRPAPGKRTGSAKRAPKGDDKAKAGEKKDAPKSGEAKSESKPKAEPKSTDQKSGDAKPAAAPAAKRDKPEKSD
ncbi:MAG TPA: hypothetical protein VGF53_08230 [Pseudolabrys sp.]|jgi:hypothetical protein